MQAPHFCIAIFALAVMPRSCRNQQICTGTTRTSFEREPSALHLTRCRNQEICSTMCASSRFALDQVHRCACVFAMQEPTLMRICVNGWRAETLCTAMPGLGWSIFRTQSTNDRFGPKCRRAHDHGVTQPIPAISQTYTRHMFKTRHIPLKLKRDEKEVRVKLGCAKLSICFDIE